MNSKQEIDIGFGTKVNWRTQIMDLSSKSSCSINVVDKHLNITKTKMQIAILSLENMKTQTGMV